MNITRNQTEAEKADFQSLYGQSAESKFKKEMEKHHAEATKKGLPFAHNVADSEYKEYFLTKKNMILKKYGGSITADAAEEIRNLKMPITDWKKYSDLTNFELIDTKKVRDDHLSREHKTPVYVESRVYHYKGYGYKYRVMEDRDSAIERAYKKESSKKA